MKKHLGYTIICAVFFILSCSPESPRTEEIRKEIEEAKKNIEIVSQKSKNVSEKLNEIWLRSLKYRFYDIREIISNQEISLQTESQSVDFLESIRFKFLNQHKTLEIICNYKTDKNGVKPKFYLYIFDQRGVNIHKEEIVYKNWFKRTLEPNKLQTKKYKITINSELLPTHFLIRKEI